MRNFRKLYRIRDADITYIQKIDFTENYANELRKVFQTYTPLLRNMITSDFGSLDDSEISVEGIEELWGWLNFKMDKTNIELLFESLLEENPYASGTCLYCSEEITNFNTSDVVFREKQIFFNRTVFSLLKKAFCLVVTTKFLVRR